MKNSIAVVGGDMRQIYLANILSRLFDDVRAYGLDSEKLSIKVRCESEIDKAIKNADIVICPIPLSSDKSIDIYEVADYMDENQTLIGGKMPKDLKIEAIDILDYPEFAVLNAIATAEGAIKEAIELSHINLHNSNALVMGFGKCGKILANKLKGIGAKVTVEARKAEDLAFIEAYGYEPLHLRELGENIGAFDFIFNTIPELMIDKVMLLNIKKSCVIVDIASAPGGVDFEEAKRLGIKAVLSLGIPGKVSPKTSAEMIWKVVKEEVEKYE